VIDDTTDRTDINLKKTNYSVVFIFGVVIVMIYEYILFFFRFLDSDIEDEVVNKRSYRRDEHRDDLPLHNAALHELLSDVMKHEAAWPFLRPVQPKEVMKLTMK